MSDFGFWEILVTVAVALLIVGPERLPGLLRDVGHGVRRLRQLATDFKDEFMREEPKLIEDVRQIHNEVTSVGQEVNKNLSDIKPLADALQEQIDHSQRYAPTQLDNDLVEVAGEEADQPQTPAMNQGDTSLEKPRKDTTAQRG